MAKAAFFIGMAMAAFLAWSYLMFYAGKLRERGKLRRDGVVPPKRQQQLLREAAQTMRQVTAVSSLDNEFNILTDPTRRSVDNWLRTYERENT